MAIATVGVVTRLESTEVTSRVTVSSLTRAIARHANGRVEDVTCGVAGIAKIAESVDGQGVFAIIKTVDLTVDAGSLVTSSLNEAESGVDFGVVVRVAHNALGVDSLVDALADVSSDLDFVAIVGNSRLQLLGHLVDTVADALLPTVGWLSVAMGRFTIALLRTAEEAAEVTAAAALAVPGLDRAILLSLSSDGHAGSKCESKSKFHFVLVLVDIIFLVISLYIFPLILKTFSEITDRR